MEYFLDLVSKKRIKKIKNNYLLIAFSSLFVFIFLGVILILLELNIIGYILIGVGFLFFIFFLINAKETSIKKSIVQSETRKFLLVLPEIIATILTEINNNSSINLIYLLTEKYKNNSIINEIGRLIELGRDLDILAKYFDDDILIDFLELMRIILYKKYNKEEEVLEFLKEINEKLNIRITVNVDRIRSKMENFIIAINVVMIFVPLLALLGLAVLFYFTKNLLLVFLISLVSSLIIFGIVLVIVYIIKQAEKKIFDKV